MRMPLGQYANTRSFVDAPMTKVKSLLLPWARTHGIPGVDVKYDAEHNVVLTVRADKASDAGLRWLETLKSSYDVEKHHQVELFAARLLDLFDAIKPPKEGYDTTIGDKTRRRADLLLRGLREDITADGRPRAQFVVPMGYFHDDMDFVKRVLGDNPAIVATFDSIFRAEVTQVFSPWAKEHGFSDVEIGVDSKNDVVVTFTCEPTKIA